MSNKLYTYKYKHFVMTTLTVLIFLVIVGYAAYYIINLLMRKRITESFTDDSVDVNNMDSHYFLTKSLMPGKVDITNLVETNPAHTDYTYVDDKSLVLEQTSNDVTMHRPSKLSYEKIKDQLTCIDENHPIREKIKEYQPYMYDEAEIINYYDYPFYRDWRFGERPIDIQFLANESKYCEKHAINYPCYKYYSKW